LPVSAMNDRAAVSTSKRTRRATGAPRRTLAVVRVIPFARRDTAREAIVSEKLQC
jgi:hypothetical protein